MELLTPQEINGLTRDTPMRTKVEEPEITFPMRVTRAQVFDVAEKVLGRSREQIPYCTACEVFLARQKALCIEKSFRIEVNWCPYCDKTYARTDFVKHVWRKHRKHRGLPLPKPHPYRSMWPLIMVVD